MPTEILRPSALSWGDNNGNLLADVSASNIWDNNTGTYASIYGNVSWPAGGGAGNCSLSSFTTKTKTWSSYTVYVYGSGVGSDGSSGVGQVDIEISTNGGTNWTSIGTMTCGAGFNSDYTSTPLSLPVTGNFTGTVLVRFTISAIGGTNGINDVDNFRIYEVYIVGNYPKSDFFMMF